MSEPLGLHLLVEGTNAPFTTLNDPDEVRRAVLAAVDASGAELLELSVHQFSPQGLTIVATLAESHLAVHTWPERGAFAADLFHCASFDTDAVAGALVQGLKAERWQASAIQRGA